MVAALIQVHWQRIRRLRQHTLYVMMLNKTSGAAQGWRWSQRRSVAPSIRSIQDPARRGQGHASLRVVIKEGAQAEHATDEPLEDFKHVVDVEQFRKLGYEVGNQPM